MIRTLLSLLPVAVPSAIALAASAQTAASFVAVARFLAGAATERRIGVMPPVTVLKPLHGDEPLLEEALASVCLQDYPEFQIVFGVQHRDDPVIAVVDRLRDRFPAVEMTLVIDAASHGPNRKVSNLINMLPAARHATLVISDADIHAEPAMLRSVVRPLTDGVAGLVTTLYTGLPASRSPWRLLGAAQINQAFLPGALMGRALGRTDCLGAVMALRRSTLDAIGGFQSLLPHLADDAVLGRKVREHGLAVWLAGTVPATSVTERHFGELFSHELRWGRTVRSQAPIGYPLSALQAPIAWALLALAASPSVPTLALLLAAWAVRVGVGRRLERALLGRVVTPFWIAPLRDALTLIVIVASHAGNRVAWRGQRLHTRADINLRAEPAGINLRAETGNARPAMERHLIEQTRIEQSAWRSAN